MRIWGRAWAISSGDWPVSTWPGIDNIGGQVWQGAQDMPRRLPSMCQDDAGFYHYMLGRMGASMGAIDPRKKGRCMCENFGAYGWRMGVKTEKYLMDHFLARGRESLRAPCLFTEGISGPGLPAPFLCPWKKSTVPGLRRAHGLYEPDLPSFGWRKRSGGGRSSLPWREPVGPAVMRAISLPAGH